MRTEYKEGDLLTKEDVGLVFKTGEGEEIKIIHFFENTNYPILGTNKENGWPSYYNSMGKSNILSEPKWNIVSFVGPDFTEDKKQPRIFTYEGYLNEFNINKGGNLKNFKCKITVEELLND